MRFGCVSARPFLREALRFGVFIKYVIDFSYVLMFPMTANGEENGCLHFIHAPKLARDDVLVRI